MFIRKWSTIGLIVVVAFIMFTGRVMAAGSEYRSCQTSSTCTVGEFLYDDSYVPITTATCTFTSRYPNGTLFLNAVNMSSGTDGWYYYDISTDTTEGVYRSQICCTAGSDYLCLDKTFEVEAASGSNLSAADIWNYPTRSLTSFGTLVSDIWSYSSRSVNSVSSLVSSIWSNSDRTLTSNTLTNGSLATESNVDAVESQINSLDSKVSTVENKVDTVDSKVDTIETSTSTTNTNSNTTIQNITSIENKLDTVTAQQAETNQLLEQIVNEPIIETFIEEGSTPTLEAKIKATREIANQLYSDTQHLKGRIGLIASSWSSIPSDDARNEVTLISRTLGTTSPDPQAESLSGQISWLSKVWKNPVIDQLAAESQRVTANTELAQQIFRTVGKSPSVQSEFSQSLESIQNLEELIGNSSDDIESQTLFGYLKQMEFMAQSLDEYALALDELLENWDSYSQTEREKTLSSLSRKILAINQLPDALAVVDESYTQKKDLQNKALALRAIVSINQALLAQNPEDTAKFIWLENGSIVFRSLVTNPSKTLTQKVPIKYYLPKEVTQEDVILLDDDLKLEYDANEDAIFVSGEAELGPEETRTFSVEVQDIWRISDEEILALRKQTETLFQPLKDTSYFAQGATLKADIDVSLDKIIRLQKEAQTPEARIRAYRLAQIELNGVYEKLESLKTLVSSAGSVGTVFGFVGGVQTIAVWGLIIILVAGFVFLGLYIRIMTQGAQAKKPLQKKAAPKPSAAKDSHENSPPPKKGDEKTTTAEETIPLHQRLLKFAHAHQTESKPKHDQHTDGSVAKSAKKTNDQDFDHSHHDHHRFSFYRGIMLFLGFFTVIGLLLILVLLTKSGGPLLSPLPSNTTTQDLFSRSNEALEITTEKRIEALEKDEAESIDTELSQETVIISDDRQVLGATTDTSDQVKTEPTRVTVIIPSYAPAVNVRKHPTTDSEILTRIWISQTMTKVGQVKDWTQVEIAVEKNGQSFTEGWISNELLVEEEE